MLTVMPISHPQTIEIVDHPKAGDDIHVKRFIVEAIDKQGGRWLLDMVMPVALTQDLQMLEAQAVLNVQRPGLIASALFVQSTPF